MSSFDFFFSLFGLILGLSVAVVISGMTDILRERHRLPIGWLTPMLGLSLLFDLTTQWVNSWTGLRSIEVAFARRLLSKELPFRDRRDVPGQFWRSGDGGDHRSEPRGFPARIHPIRVFDRILDYPDCDVDHPKAWLSARWPCRHSRLGALCIDCPLAPALSLSTDRRMSASDPGQT
jgi:hypothetical protein